MIVLLSMERADADCFRAVVERDGMRRTYELLMSRVRDEQFPDEIKIWKDSPGIERDFAEYSERTRYYLQQLLRRTAQAIDAGEPLELPKALDPSDIILARHEPPPGVPQWALSEPGLLEGVVYWLAPRCRPGRRVFRSRVEMAAEWRAHGGDPNTMPVVDFAKHTVVALFWDFKEVEDYLVHADIADLRLNGETLEVVVDPHARAHPYSRNLSHARVWRVKRHDGPVVFVDSHEA